MQLNPLQLQQYSLSTLMHTDNVTIPAQIHPEGSPEWERVS